jgi:hypothetical protein
MFSGLEAVRLGPWYSATASNTTTGTGAAALR